MTIQVHRVCLAMALASACQQTPGEECPQPLHSGAIDEGARCGDEGVAAVVDTVGGLPTLRKALAQPEAAQGAEVEVCAGEHDVGLGLTDGGRFRLRCEQTGACTLSAPTGERHLSLRDGELELTGLTLLGDGTAVGGNGGSLWLQDSHLSLLDATIRQTRSAGAGGAIYLASATGQASITLTRVTVDDTHAGTLGGGLALRAEGQSVRAVLDEVELSGVSAQSGGAVALGGAGALYLELGSSHISQSSASGRGGALALLGDASEIVLRASSSTSDGASAADGGFLSVESWTPDQVRYLRLDDVRVQEATASSAGGGLWLGGEAPVTLDADQLMLQDTSAGKGAGALDAVGAELSGVHLSVNLAEFSHVRSGPQSGAVHVGQGVALELVNVDFGPDSAEQADVVAAFETFSSMGQGASVLCAESGLCTSEPPR